MKNFKSIVKKSTNKTKLKVDVKKIRNVEITFLDIDGNLREVIIPKTKLEKVVIGGLKCDGSSIGLKNVTNSDMNIIVDKNCIYPLPNKNLMVIAYTDFSFDARSKLLELEKRFCTYSVNIGTELEFFLTSKENKFDNLNYFECEESPAFNCLNDVMEFCESVNFPIESFHHECGHSQFEVNFKYNTPHITADNILYIKKVIGFFANKYNLVASFLPKPFETECGSGMHTNISVFNKKRNLFYSNNNELNLSEFAYKFANNLINHVGAITFLANPCKNSYERLSKGTETPKTATICGFNRTSLIRVPKANEKSTRIEFRLPDAKANPYLLFSAIIIAGFDNSLSCKTTNNNLPKTLTEAKKSFVEDNLLNTLLPTNFTK